MNKNRKNTVRKVVYYSFFLLLFYNILFAQEPLKYEVAVDAMLIPLFAVDGLGNPIYDLKQEELKLFVNGIPVKIDYFNQYFFEYDKEVIHSEVKKENESVIKNPDRVIFIIIDKVFNSYSGLKCSKKIASNLIKEGGKGDRFVLIEITSGKGLKYIGGPESTNEDLIKKIARIKSRTLLRMKSLQLDHIRASNQGDTRIRHIIRNTKINDIGYQSTIKRFSYVLSQIKYALKTIIRPKIVFLISEGVSRSAFMYSPNNAKVSFNFFLFNYLKDIVKSVNQGGCVLYTINPQKISKSIDQINPGEMSLRVLASESGGKYFAGSNTERIIRRIKKTTAAYYELAFLVSQELGEQLEFTVKCKRKGVRIHTLNQSERNRPYHKMDTVQKKLFAFNAVTSGSWSRMVGEVNKTKFEKQQKEKNKYTVSLDLPEEMKNCDLDVFLIDTDPNFEAVNINFKTRKSAEKFELNISREKNKHQYFVIIEPLIPNCIYNKIF